MTHEEFKEEYKAGRIAISVNRSRAVGTTMSSSYTAKKYRASTNFWSWVIPDNIPDVDYKVSLSRRKSVTKGYPVYDATITPVKPFEANQE